MNYKRPWAKLLLCIALAAGWWALLTFSLPIGDAGAPPLGDFLNPYTGFYRNNGLNYHTDNLDLPGLRAPVDVVYDERMVPHIYASSTGDLYYAQGYIQAQHRLFQLDLTARSSDGRLSEVLGDRTLKIDRERLRIGARKAASQIDSMWQRSPQAYEIVQRYADGVNAYIATLELHEYPIEYKLLQFAPEAWSPRKTALVAISMAFTLNSHNEDIPATNTRELLGAESFNFLFPERTDLDRPVMPRGTKFLGRDSVLIRANENLQFGLSFGESLKEPIRKLRGASGFEPLIEGLGSNNWAIAGSRSKSGFAMLANDPHLQLTLPSIWFESELHAGGLHVHGVNLPGVPGITIGFNEQAAWGVTNVGIDVLDWYEIEYTNPTNTRYKTPFGKTAELTYRVETIKVRNAADVLDTVAITEYGPIVFTDPDDYRFGLAMNWLTVQEPSSQTIDAFLGLNRAHKMADFVKASYELDWPAQNIIFANTNGDIALRVSGSMPRRYNQEGRFVLANNSPDAQGNLTDQENPIAVNPLQGYLASTNQVSTEADYPYYYLGFFEHTRSRRINDLLQGAGKFGMEDMAKFQLDDYYVAAADITPALLQLVDRSDLSQAGLGQLAMLQNWNYNYKASGIEPILFERWIDAVARKTWDEIFNASDDAPLLTPDRSRLAELLQNDPLSPWFDVKSTPERETARQLITEAFREVTDELENYNDGDMYGWAEENDVRIGHLAKIPAFSRNDLRVGGRSGTLNAQRGDVGPSWRMLVQLGTPVSARVVYPGGQSGRPGHAHYDDMVDAWSAGEYYDAKLHMDKNSFGESATQQFTLEPQN